MQKVEGSSPFSRFSANPLHVGGLGLAREPRINWNHPRIRRYFRHYRELVPGIAGMEEPLALGRDEVLYMIQGASPCQGSFREVLYWFLYVSSEITRNH
jgi:hypothetical protein